MPFIRNNIIKILTLNMQMQNSKQETYILQKSHVLLKFYMQKRKLSNPNQIIMEFFMHKKSIFWKKRITFMPEILDVVEYYSYCFTDIY